jgi:hypothetical protein
MDSVLDLKDSKCKLFKLESSFDSSTSLSQLIEEDNDLGEMIYNLNLKTILDEITCNQDQKSLVVVTNYDSVSTYAGYIAKKYYSLSVLIIMKIQTYHLIHYPPKIVRTCLLSLLIYIYMKV